MEKPGFEEEVGEPNMGYQSPKACPKQSGTVEWPNPCISYWSILCFFMIECAIYCFKQQDTLSGHLPLDKMRRLLAMSLLGMIRQCGFLRVS